MDVGVYTICRPESPYLLDYHPGIEKSVQSFAMLVDRDSATSLATAADPLEILPPHITDYGSLCTMSVAPCAG